MTLLVLLIVVVMLSNDATIATTTDERNTAAAQCLREQRALAAAAASHSFGLSTDRAEPFSPEEAALAAGVSHATRGGGLWHVPSPPPPPLPQLAIGECPSKTAFGCRERDRPRFSAAEWRLRRDAYDAARDRHRDACRIATDCGADLNAESGGDTDLPSSDGDDDATRDEPELHMQLPATSSAASPSIYEYCQPREYATTSSATISPAQAQLLLIMTPATTANCSAAASNITPVARRTVPSAREVRCAQAQDAEAGATSSVSTEARSDRRSQRSTAGRAAPRLGAGDAWGLGSDSAWATPSAHQNETAMDLVGAMDSGDEMLEEEVAPVEELATQNASQAARKPVFTKDDHRRKVRRQTIVVCRSEPALQWCKPAADDTHSGACVSVPSHPTPRELSLPRWFDPSRRYCVSGDPGVPVCYPPVMPLLRNATSLKHNAESNLGSSGASGALSCGKKEIKNACPASEGTRDPNHTSTWSLTCERSTLP